MSNDKTTLADVQPGRRVRLGYRLPEAVARALATVNEAANDARHAGNYKVANALVTARVTLSKQLLALSAQPSPGGQGDAPPCWWIDHGTHGQITQRQDEADAAVNAGKRVVSYAARQPVDENYEVWAQNAENVAAELTDERAIKALRFAARGIRSAARHPVRIYGCCAQPEGELHAAECPNMRHLAARQPVGEIDEAAVLRRASAVLYMREDDPNLTGYMGDFKDACGILELLAQHAAPPAQAVDLAPASIPDTPDVRDILGRPNFWCSPWANVLRMRGDEIPHKAEEEQAAVIRFMLNHYLANGTAWAETAGAELDTIRKVDSQAVGNG